MEHDPHLSVAVVPVHARASDFPTVASGMPYIKGRAPSSHGWANQASVIEALCYCETLNRVEHIVASW